MPAQALAEATYDDDGYVQRVTIDPYTYVNHTDWLEGNELSFSSLKTISDQLSKDWASVAGGIYSVYGTNGGNADFTIDSDDNKKKWDDSFGPSVPILAANGYNSETHGYRVNVMDALATSEAYNMDGGNSWTYENGMSGQKYYTYLTSGLQYATNLDDIAREMAEMSATGVLAFESASEMANHKSELAASIYEKTALDAFKATDDDAKATKAFYRIVTSSNPNSIFEGPLADSISPGTYKHFFNTYALVFYDFSLTPLLVDGVKAKVKETSTPEAGKEYTNTSYFENKSKQESEVTATIGTEAEESVTNTMETTKSFTYTTELGIETKFGMEDVFDFLNVEQTISTKFGTEESVETAWGKESSVSNHVSSESSSTVTLPAHTAVALKQSTNKVETTHAYDCPVALNYKVAVLAMCGQARGWKEIEKAEYVRSLATIFGSGSTEGGMYAPQNLYVRALDPATANSVDVSYGQVQAVGQSGNKTSKIDWKKVNAKLADFGTSYTDHLNKAATEIPAFNTGAKMTFTSDGKTNELGQIQPLYQLTDVKLVEGEDEYTLAVGDKLNLANLGVDGFNQYGVEYYGFDPDEGEWVIDDAESESGVIELETTKTGRVSVNALKQGEGKTIVGKALNIFNTFKASVYDKKDRLISRDVIYELQDQDAVKRGVLSIDEGGAFVSTEPGDYLVRAVYYRDGASIESDWLTVHVAAMPEAAADPAELGAESGEATVTLTGELLSDGIEVTLTDEQDDSNTLTAKTTGSDTEQKATFTLPENTVFNTDHVYKVSYKLTEEDAATQTEATVTVKANTLTKVEANDATCTEDGNIDYWVCNETQKLYTGNDQDGYVEVAAKDVVLPKLGHDLVKVEAKDASCDEDGNIDYWACSRCPAVFADEAGTQETTVEDCAIEATGHDWGEWQVVTEATEDAYGQKQRVCAKNSEHVMTQVIDKLAHEHQLTKTEAKDASCEEDGNIAYWTCSDCGKKYSDEAATTEVTDDEIVVKATGHVWGDWQEVTPATEEAEGREQRTCSVNSEHVETRSIPKTTHVHAPTHVEAQDPTCTEDGKIEHWVCEGDDGCGRLFSDAAGQSEVNAEDVVRKALGHEWDEGVADPAATCTTEGTVTFSCTHAGCNETKTKSIPALGHKWDEGTVKLAATCLSTGVLTKTCQNDGCGVTSDEEIPSLGGHKWDEGVVTTQPTCTSKGVKTYTCANDPKHTRTEDLPALGHEWSDSTYTWSKDGKTCTAKRVCKNDKTHVQTAKAKVTSKVTKKPTAKKAGSRTRTATFSVTWAKTQTRTEVIPATGMPSVSGKAYIQGTGWISYVDNGRSIGSTGHSKRLEGLRLKLKNADVKGGIEYRAHVQNIGWEDSWSSNGEMCGAAGKGKRLEAVQIRLYGKMAKKYDVYYRVHVQDYGWMAWAKNGAKAGTAGKSKRVEAVQVVLVEKGAKAPNKTYKGVKQDYAKAYVKK